MMNGDNGGIVPMAAPKHQTTADSIRKYCLDHYVEPARAKRAYTVTIRSGDVRRGLKLKDRLPQVCSALGTDLFEPLADVRRISIDGPVNASDALFTFLLLSRNKRQ